MAVIRRETVADQSAALLRRRIIRGALRPGDPVTEEALAEELGVSRATVRQVLNTLLLEGLLTRHPTTRVLQVTTLTADDVHDIYRARRFLELGGVDAAANASAAQLAEVVAAVDDLEQTVSNGEVVEFVEADNRCHTAIVELLGSVHLGVFHAGLMAKLRLVITASERDGDDELRDHLKVHRQFVKLLTAGRTADARSNLERRLVRAEKQVVEEIVRLSKLASTVTAHIDMSR